ncbi:MAG: UDP-N-acetylmuramoyl-L-alanine--D-glutamate ligase [Patescibacteria group bacterium]
MIDQQQVLANLEKNSILILGMGREGWSTYYFLRTKFPNKKLAVADKQPLEKFAEDQQQLLKDDPHLEYYFGDNHLTNLKNYQLIFKSPGIPQTIPAIDQAKQSGSQLTSNTQLFFALCPGITIGVTGTKGKSTTSAIIHHVLKSNDLASHLVGNIGQPALTILEKINADSLVVCELSSHQLETMTISPHIAVVQDVTSEHLDYYQDTASYQQAKTPICKYQTKDDFVIFNPQMLGATKITQFSAGQHLRFSTQEGPDAIVFVRNKQILRKDNQQRTELILETNKLPLKGEHNLLNVMPAVVVGTLFNLSAAQIGQALQNFKALPHRLEFFYERKGIRYYDDSLSTMPAAAMRALDSFSEPIVLLAGGYERQQDFSDLAKKILEKKVVGLVLFEPTGKRLAAEIDNLVSNNKPIVEFASQMKEAVSKAQQIITEYFEKSGENQGIILLSPASASFGAFKDYQDRGEQFKKAVKTD